jgi:hypothetical protein
VEEVETREREEGERRRLVETLKVFTFFAEKDKLSLPFFVFSRERGALSFSLSLSLVREHTLRALLSHHRERDSTERNFERRRGKRETERTSLLQSTSFFLSSSCGTLVSFLRDDVAGRAWQGRSIAR